MSSSLTGPTTLKSSITPVIIYFLQSEQFLPGQCVIICSQDSFIHLRIFKTNHPIIHFNITSLSSRFSRQSCTRSFYTKFLYPYVISTSTAIRMSRMSDPLETTRFHFGIAVSALLMKVTQCIALKS
jgi:hypothetical protein